MPDLIPERPAPSETNAEFLAVATGVINGLERELRRVKPEERARWRALEIGCGSGRLMRPMSRHFLELHGVDTSGKLVAEARENLRDVPLARLHLSEGRGLADFADDSLHFVYSYDFFPHIPNREVALDFLRECHRVMQAGALARLEFSGISGSAFSSRELLEFAAAHDFQVLALEGVSTPSMWTTWLKRPSGWSQNVANAFDRTDAAPPAIIRRITNASSFEPVAPCRGRFASIALRVENLPPDAGLNHVRATIGNSLGTVTRIEAADRTGWQQVRVDLPELEATGLLPVQLLWLDLPLSEPATLRVIPPGPSIPRMVYAPKRTDNRVVRVTIDEVARPYELEVSLGGHPVEDVEKVCTDSRKQRYQVKFRLPEEIGPGLHHVHIKIGRRRLAPLPLHVDA